MMNDLELVEEFMKQEPVPDEGSWNHARTLLAGVVRQEIDASSGLRSIDGRQRIAPSRVNRRRKLMVATGVAAAILAVGGAAAAMSGLFNERADKAFNVENSMTPEGIAANGAASRRLVMSKTPDGGNAELWISPMKDATHRDVPDRFCTAVLFDDAGNIGDKPYVVENQASCGGVTSSLGEFWGDQGGATWVSKKTQKTYSAIAGFAGTADRIEDRFPDGSVIGAKIENGWYLMFVPYELSDKGHVTVRLDDSGHVIDQREVTATASTPG